MAEVPRLCRGRLFHFVGGTLVSFKLFSLVVEIPEIRTPVRIRSTMNRRCSVTGTAHIFSLSMRNFTRERSPRHLHKDGLMKRCLIDIP